MDKKGKEVHVTRELRFIDSFAFMSKGLDKLVNDLNGNLPKTIQYLEDKGYCTTTLLRKGVYPYSYFDSFDKFNEEKLPEIEKCFDILSNKKMPKEEYNYMCDVYKLLNCKNLGDYHDFYLKMDVLLLVDVFEKFREMSLENYKLDPAHYYGAPGLSWDAMLKNSNVELELISDHEMFLMFEKGKRGGVSQITTRYFKANNKYLPDYNKAKLLTFLAYLDANNLYGFAMMKKLPYENFRWLTDYKEIINKIGSFTGEEETGYLLEVDLEYSDELHDLHNDYPLAPLKEIPNYEDLSKYQIKLISNKKGKKPIHEKLLCTLKDKSKYVLNYMTLQLYMQLGLKLKKVHRIISYSQKAFIKSYIEKNTELRQNSKNDFEKDFFKLMNNIIFGKSIENIRNRTYVKLCNNSKQFNRYINKLLSFKNRTIIDKDLVLVQRSNIEVTLNKPIYIGTTILDYAKNVMYDFWYNKLKKKYDDRIILCFTDTDSLFVLIKTEDYYEDIKENIDTLGEESWYDTSAFKRKDIPKVNKKVPGKFKDELPNSIIAEYVGLRSKMHAERTLDATHDERWQIQELKVCKGIKKQVIEEDTHFSDYKNTLDNESIETRTYNLIRSKHHELSTIKTTKITLSPFDDKRYICDDGISTMAYGHTKLRNKVVVPSA